MNKLMEKVRKTLGVETDAERKEWGNRAELLRDTVGINYFEPVFVAQKRQEMELIEASTNRLIDSYSLEILAEERLRLRALCLARCALPSEGITVPELNDLGFNTGPKGRNRYWGHLLMVEFPEGWNMTPVRPEPSLTESSFAIVFDEVGQAQLDVFYRNSVVGNSDKGHTHVVPPSNA